MPSSSASPRPIERNVRLDPLGVYGTRSSRRRHQLQRRRRWQNSLLWALGLAALGAGMWWVFQPHPTTLRADWTRQLPFRPATQPSVSPSGQLFYTSQSGGLWTLPDNPGAQPKRLFATGFAPGAAPLVTANRIYWPGGDGVLFALDATTGRTLWTHTFASALVTKPALMRFGNRALVAVGDDEGQVSAFDASSGAAVWTRNVGGPAGEAIVNSGGAKPALLVPMLAGVATRGGLMCLDALTGAPRWRFPTDPRSQSAGIAAPAVQGNQVFWANDQGSVVSLDVSNGRKIWKNFAAPVSVQKNAPLVTLRGAATVVPEAGIVLFGGNDGGIRAFDTGTGLLRWTVALRGAARFPAQVVNFEGHSAVLIGCSAPDIRLLDARDGSLLRRWTPQFDASQGVWTHGEMAFALDADGHLQGATLR